MGLGLRNVVLQSNEKYEYMLFNIRKYSYKQTNLYELNKLGADGWEVICDLGEDILLKKNYIVSENTVS